VFTARYGLIAYIKQIMFRLWKVTCLNFKPKSLFFSVHVSTYSSYLQQNQYAGVQKWTKLNYKQLNLTRDSYGTETGLNPGVGREISQVSKVSRRAPRTTQHIVQWTSGACPWEGRVAQSPISEAERVEVIPPPFHAFSYSVQRRWPNSWTQFSVLTHSLTHSLTPHSTVLLEKLTGLQLVKKFPKCYRTRMFITAFTSACHLSLSWASSIQSISHNPLPEDPS
jgi:hypothetical protein